ncbi:cation:proton antiporter [Streptomyces sp. NPDC088246]|uniref:cation:proton antiporter domain-containing protein n=1 Tax=Streptomyces sp. NPDC088246 TaxID=3365842 RepID=UPI00381BA362
MRGLEVTVVVLAAVAISTWPARRLRWNEPVLLVAGGCLIGLTPDFRTVVLPPDVVLLLFLPPLLHWESLTTSLREIRTNARGITLLATGLVLTTAAAVAVVGHALGLSWPLAFVLLAFVLGAVVAPTDAIAVASLARDLPRRVRTILRAESLINDGTALALYAVVAGIVVEDQGFSRTGAVARFLLAYGGGIAIGSACAVVVVALRRQLRDRVLESALAALTRATGPPRSERPRPGTDGIAAVDVDVAVSSGLSIRPFRCTRSPLPRLRAGELLCRRIRRPGQDGDLGAHDVGDLEGDVAESGEAVDGYLPAGAGGNEHADHY